MFVMRLAKRSARRNECAKALVTYAYKPLKDLQQISNTSNQQQPPPTNHGEKGLLFWGSNWLSIDWRLVCHCSPTISNGLATYWQSIGECILEVCAEGTLCAQFYWRLHHPHPTLTDWCLIVNHSPTDWRLIVNHTPTDHEWCLQSLGNHRKSIVNQSPIGRQAPADHWQPSPEQSGRIEELGVTSNSSRRLKGLARGCQTPTNTRGTQWGPLTTTHNQ